MIEAVVFDLDGVIVDSEPVWEQVAPAGGGRARRSLAPGSAAAAHGHEHRRMGQVSQPGPGRRAAGAHGRGDGHRADAGPLPRWGPAHAGCGRGGRGLATRWPLGLASSSPPALIDATLDSAGLRACFRVALSTEQVSRGERAPDIYLAVTDLLGFPPEACAAVEVSTNGLRSAAAAGLQVVTVPHPRYPPEPAALHAARLVLTGLDG